MPILRYFRDQPLHALKHNRSSAVLFNSPVIHNRNTAVLFNSRVKPNRNAAVLFNSPVIPNRNATVCFNSPVMPNRNAAVRFNSPVKPNRNAAVLFNRPVKITSCLSRLSALICNLGDPSRVLPEVRKSWCNEPNLQPCIPIGST